MSLSYHLWLRAARRATIDPEDPKGGYLTQTRLAELAGCSMITISKAERGKHIPMVPIRRELYRLLPSIEQLEEMKIISQVCQ